MTAQATPASSTLACNQVLPLAMKNLAAHCSQLDRNQGCYGNPTVHVEYVNPSEATATPVVFQQSGDIKAVRRRAGTAHD